MPDEARLGLSRPFSSATSVNSAGTADSRSTSPLRNASHRAWPSSITEISMRGTSGSRLSFSAATSGCDAAGTGPTGT